MIDKTREKILNCKRRFVAIDYANNIDGCIISRSNNLIDVIIDCIDTCIDGSTHITIYSCADNKIRPFVHGHSYHDFDKWYTLCMALLRENVNIIDMEENKNE